MSRRLPKGVKDSTKCQKKKVLIICEVQEEKMYIDRLIKLDVWDKSTYDFETKNAESEYKISNMYDMYRRDEKYSIVLIFCDTDNPPYDAFLSVRDGLRRIFGGDAAFKRIVIFANPCTMRIFMAHFSEKKEVRSHKKSDNAPIIEKYTGVKNYSGKESEIKAICDKITADNYFAMKNRVAVYDGNDYTIIGNTNFTKYLNWFECSETAWMTDINKSLGYK